MSFSINFKAKYEDVPREMDKFQGPAPVSQFILDAVNAIAKNETVTSNGVAVTCYGHLHTGMAGDYAHSTATISVEPADIP